MTCGMKSKDFRAPVLFSSTFQALKLGLKNSSTFKDFQGCVRTLQENLRSRGKNVSNTFNNSADNYSGFQCFLNTSLAVFQLLTVHEKTYP